MTGTIALPAFPTALIPMGTTKAPSIYLPPTTDQSPNPQTELFIHNADGSIDPFRANSSRFIQFSPKPMEQQSLPIVGEGETKSVVISMGPARKLKKVKETIETARNGRTEGNRPKAAKAYREALGILETPADASSAAPLYHEIPEGDTLFTEALFGAAGFSGHTHAPDILNRLHAFTDSPPSSATPLDIAKAELLKAFTRFGFASAADEPVEQSFKDILESIHSTIEGFDWDDEGNDDIIFYGNLLSIEVLHRLLGHAHNRGDHKQEHEYAGEIKNAFKRINHPGISDAKVQVIAEYKADIATFMARIGLWGPALERARRLTALGQPLRKTPGAARLLSEPIFEPFIDDNGSTKVFLDAGEVRLRARKGSWRRRVQTAVAMAHSQGLKETALWGFLGLGSGLAIDTLFAGGEHTTLIGAAMAAGFTVFNRLRNGWGSPEAVYASEIGVMERTWEESAWDAGKVLLQGGIDSIVWVVPAAVANAGMGGMEAGYDTLARAGDLYGSFGEWVSTGTPKLVEAETYTTFFSNLANANPAALAYLGYTWFSGGAFAASLFSKRAQAFTEKYGAALLPGAAGLSANIGMLISGAAPMDFNLHFDHPEYWDRIQRSMLVSAEMLALQLTAGLLPLENRSSIRKAAKSAFAVLNPFSKESNYGLPLAGATMANVGSALGGLMQEGNPPDNLTTMAIVGAATTFGLIPIVLGISGVLKGKIPIGTGLKEGWQDSKGEVFAKRIYESLAGGLDAFNYPYAHNRIFRSFSWDLVAAALRTMVGWDTNAGQALMSGTNYIAGNGAATATWPETGGTLWERNAISKWTACANDKLLEIERKKADGLLNDEEYMAAKHAALSQLHDFMYKVSQVMHPLHPIMPHANIATSVWPGHSFTRAWAPPKFAHIPNQYFFSNHHQMIAEGDLTPEQIGAEFEYLSAFGRDPNNRALLNPLVQQLNMNRGEEGMGEIVDAYFKANPWLEDLFTIDKTKHVAPEDALRRKKRKKVRKAVKVKFEDHQVAVKSHGTQQKGAHHYDGLFIVRPHPDGTPPASKTLGADSMEMSISNTGAPLGTSPDTAKTGSKASSTPKSE